MAAGGRIAQLVEQLTLNQRAVGSSPTAPTNQINALERKMKCPPAAVLILAGMAPHFVMAGPVPAIPATAVPAVSCAILTARAGGDGRDRPGHDDVAIRHHGTVRR